MGMAATLPRVQQRKRKYRVWPWGAPAETQQAVIITAYTNDQARRYGPRMLLWNLGLRVERVHVHLAGLEVR